MQFIKVIFYWHFWISLLTGLLIIYCISFYTLDWIKEYTNFGETITIPCIKNKTIKEAIKILKTHNLHYEIDSFKFNPNYKPLEVILTYPKEGNEVKRGRKIFIRCNPKNWELIIFPNIVGKNKYLAFSQIQMLGLEIGDILYKNSLIQDRIIKVLYEGKEIKTGDYIRKYSKIDVIIGLTSNKKNIVPNIINLDYKTAAIILKNNNFIKGIVTFKDNQDTLNARIFYQNPLAGTKLDKGLSVNFWLSTEVKENLKDEINNLNKLHHIKSSITESDKIKKEFKNQDSLRIKNLKSEKINIIE